MRRRRAETRPEPLGRRSFVRQAVLRFASWSIVALVVVAIGTILVSEHIARDASVRDASQRGTAIAHGVAAPLVNRLVRSGDEDELGKMSRVIENRMRDGSVNRIKLWSSDGTMIWSDEPQLTGQRFDLPKSVSALFGTREVTAELSGMDRPEDASDRAKGPVLEVFVGAFDADGAPVVFEAHMSPKRLKEDQSAILRELLPLALGALLVFQLAMLPLAMSLARRVDRGQAERADILRRALLSSDLERRRIAQDLHDGVIQDLAGLSYALPTVVARLEPDSSADRARETARRMTSILQRDVSALRSLLADIYPPDLTGDGLAAALDDLAAGAAEAEVAVQVDLASGLEVPAETASLVYRVVREGLRNVVRHADAARAQVTVRRQGSDVLVRVTDDGRGLGDVADQERGHLGVKLLADTVGDVGGRLALRSGTTSGAVLEASFPSLPPG